MCRSNSMEDLLKSMASSVLDEAVPDEETEFVAEETETVEEETETEEERLIQRKYNEFLAYLEETSERLIENVETKFVRSRPEESVPKVDWNDVLALSEVIRRDAPIWVEVDRRKAETYKVQSESFYSLLTELLRLSRGSMVGAGATLRRHIHADVFVVVGRAICVITLPARQFDSANEMRHAVKFVSELWESLDDLKKVPTSNVSAIKSNIMWISAAMCDQLCDLNGWIRNSEAAYTSSVECPSNYVFCLSAVLDEMIKTIPSILFFLEKDTNGDMVKDFEKMAHLSRCVEYKFRNIRSLLDPPQFDPGIEDPLVMASDAVFGIQNSLTKAADAVFGIKEKLTELEGRLGPIT